jgi:hypothetical protein
MEKESPSSMDTVAINITPFNMADIDEDIARGMNTTIISETLARALLEVSSPSELIGRMISKRFHDKNYCGVVESYAKRRKMYFIRYFDDEENEEMDESELKMHLYSNGDL